MYLQNLKQKTFYTTRNAVKGIYLLDHLSPVVRREFISSRLQSALLPDEFFTLSDDIARFLKILQAIGLVQIHRRHHRQVETRVDRPHEVVVDLFGDVIRKALIGDCDQQIRPKKIDDTASLTLEVGPNLSHDLQRRGHLIVRKHPREIFANQSMNAETREC